MSEREQRARKPQRVPAGRGHGALPEAVREKVLASLLSGLDVEAVAEEHEVGARTIRKWLNEDDFGGRYREALEDMRARTVEQLATGRVVGLRTLARAAKGGDVKAAEVLVKLGETKRVELSGPNGGPIEHADVPPDRAGMLERARALVAELEAQEAAESGEGDGDA